MLAIVVNSYIDHSDGNISDSIISLRDAVQLAPPGETIEFDDVSRIELTLGPLPIRQDLTIRGPGAGHLTIDAQGRSRVFEINAGASVEISGLTITGGSGTTSAASHGGGILSSGDLTLADVVIADNEAAGSGGGIFAEEGSLTIKASTITRNTALGQNEPSHGGGVAVAAASLVIEHSLIADNHAETGSGGGVYAESGQSVFVSNSTISGNVSLKKGGGMAIADVNHAEIVHGTIAANTGVSAALFVAGSTLDLGHTIVADNTARDPDAAFADFDFQETAVTARYNLIEAGRPIRGGDGNIVGVDPLLGPLANHGGTARSHPLLPGSPAIDAGDPAVLYDANEFDQRGVPFFRVVDDPNASGSGIDLGALEQQTFPSSAYVVTTTTDEVDLGNADISLREAILYANHHPGLDEITFDPARFSTPQIVLLELGELEITDAVTIAAPELSHITIDAQQQSRVLNFTTTTGNLTLRALTLQNGVTTDDNELDSFDPEQITTNSGGGIRFISAGTLSLSECVVAGNHTEGLNTNGGGIFTDGGNVVLIDSEISNNRTSVSGGGVYAHNNTTTIVRTLFQDNHAPRSGGGLYVLEGDVSVTEGSFSGNATEGHGGGAHVRRGSMSVSDTLIAGNQAKFGGGIHGLESELAIESSIVQGNLAGGGVRASRITVADSIVRNNEAFEGGAGGISGGSVTVVDSFVEDNRAVDSGGGIGGSTVELTRSTVSGNRTSGRRAHGGGVYASHSALVSDSVIKDNSTLGDYAFGGGIFAEDAEITTTSISGNATHGDHSHGGGIDAGGRLQLTDSDVRDNFTAGWMATGGGVAAFGTLASITNSTIADNHTRGRSAFGGGLRAGWTRLRVTNSTISGNYTLGTDADGGGVFGPNGQNDIQIINSTVSGNYTVGDDADGGGIHANWRNTIITSSTIVGNSAFMGFGGGIHRPSISTAEDADLWIRNSIVAGNRDIGFTPDLGLYPGDLPRIDHSLIGDTSGTSVTNATGIGNLLNQSPQLGPLADNGGPTWTHSPLPGSPVIDAGNAEYLPQDTEADQRGLPFVRHFDDPAAAGDGVDIGAVEVQTLDPTWFVVTTAVDEVDFGNDVMSLREAIHYANFSAGHDAIRFDSDVFATPQTIMLSLGEFEIRESLTIDAAALFDPVTLDADHRSRLFNFTESTGDFALLHLSLLNGRTTADNQLLGGGQGLETTHSGGAIRFLSDGTLTIVDTTLEGSQTEGQHAEGGAIFVDGGELTLTRSHVIGNRTLGDRAGGGGISVIRGRVQLADSTVAINSTAGSGAVGGGIRAFMTAVHGTGIIVSGNQTTSSLAQGGAIFAEHESVTLADSTLSGNSTRGSGGSGGAIYVHYGDLTISHSSLAGNSTYGASGGAVVARYGTTTVVHSIFHGNESHGRGGALYQLGGTLSISASEFSDNATLGDFASGGAVYAATSSSDLKLDNSTFSSNRTSGRLAHGGGLYLVAEVLDLQSVSIVGNSALMGIGGGVYVPSEQLLVPLINLRNTIIAGNLDDGTAPDLLPDPDRPVAIEYSLIGDTTGSGINSESGSGNLLNVDPHLGPLADNGGDTLTHALLPGSPAMGAGDPTAMAGEGGVPPYDQRGEPFARVSGGRIDLGAYEYQVSAADFDGDGIVGGDDFLIWQAGFGLFTGEATHADGDANGDGLVDGDDLLLWQSDFDENAGVAAEPTVATSFTRNSRRLARPAIQATRLWQARRDRDDREDLSPRDKLFAESSFRAWYSIR